MRHRAEASDVEPGARRRLRLGVGAAIVLLLGVFVVAILASAFSGQGSDVEVPASRTTSVASGAEVTSAQPDDGGGELFVHVSGAVVSPGLVTLAAGARVVDAIAAAGGLAPDGDPAGVNLARLVSDGEQLVVPKEGEVPPAAPTGSGGGSGAAGTGLVNINTAGQAELETLPRIGPALAQRILDWRAANGRFGAPTDLLKVAGIGDKVFDGLKDRVSV
ncbi:helix-hairpin-helix domain-containing protein [Leifsonia aquatica]|uniref:helix-hairpin-helix domain-containing protein n=1 Tax=Leifsonia aquatica TaxID=144185 RepID=UPI0028B1D39C|nr:helix-hairpin-helix domain-containing protein [Leifsonia aquatica]